MKIEQVQYRIITHPELDSWQREVVFCPAIQPFTLSAETIASEKFPYPYKVITSDPLRRTYVCVRTDEYPLAWHWWTLVHRIEESLRLTKYYAIHLLEVWGLAFVPLMQEPTWGCIGKKKEGDRL